MPDGNENTGPESWQQQPGETGNAYRAFAIFRDLGRTRSVGKAYRMYSGRPDAKLISSGFKKWRYKHHWDERAHAWDERTERAADQARMETVVTLARRQGEAEINWVEQRQKTREKELDFANRLMAKASDMLEIALIRRKVIPADAAAGRPETHIYEPAKWTFKTVTEFLDLATRLRRMACELPIAVIKDDKPGGGTDDDGMWATSAGILEQALPPGVVPAMPEDVTVRPVVRIARDPGEDDLRSPARVRPA